MIGHDSEAFRSLCSLLTRSQCPESHHVFIRQHGNTAFSRFTMVSCSRRSRSGPGGSGSTTHALAWSLTLWFCQNSYWKWMKMTIEIVDLPLKKNVIFHSYVNVYQRVKSTCQDLHISEIYRFCRTFIHCPTYKTRSLSAQHLSIWDTLTSHSYAVDHAETLVNIPGPRRPKKRNWSAMHSIRPRKCTDWDQESFPAAIIDGYIMYIYIYIMYIYIYHVYIYIYHVYI